MILMIFSTQEELFRVLKAYSVLNPIEGYCQAQVFSLLIISIASAIAIAGNLFAQCPLSRPQSLPCF